MPADALTLGSFQITLVREAIYHWDGGALFGVVPKSLWARKMPADDQNRIPLGFNSYVVQTGEHSVLIETGAGDKMDVRMRERLKLPPVPRPLRDALAEAGIDPESIDVVINSHLHWDHCGGNTWLRGGQAFPAFPRARYYTRRGEWEHAHARHIRDRVSYIDANYDPLVENGRMCLLEGDAEIVPGIRVHAAPGHNRDMMIVTARSAGETFCFFSDLVPTAAHLAPGWVASFDLFPLETIDNKLHWLGHAAHENWHCAFGHDPAIAFTRIAARGDKFEAAR